MFPFCAERGARLFLLDFSGFSRRYRIVCAHISLCGAVFCGFLFLFLLRSWCDGDC